MHERHEFERRLLAARSLLLNKALKLTHNKDKAEDLLQSTLLRALEHWNSYDPARAIGPWLVTIMSRLHIDTVRKTRFSDELPDDHSSVTYLTQEPGQLHRAALSELLSHVATLPVHMSATLLLAGPYGLTDAEIADKTRTRHGTVKSRIRRAKIKLGPEVLDLAVP